MSAPRHSIQDAAIAAQTSPDSALKGWIKLLSGLNKMEEKQREKTLDDFLKWCNSNEPVVKRGDKNQRERFVKGLELAKRELEKNETKERGSTRRIQELYVIMRMKDIIQVLKSQSSAAGEAMSANTQAIQESGERESTAPESEYADQSTAPVASAAAPPVPVQLVEAPVARDEPIIQPVGAPAPGQPVVDSAPEPPLVDMIQPVVDSAPEPPLVDMSQPVIFSAALPPAPVTVPMDQPAAAALPPASGAAVASRRRMRRENMQPDARKSARTDEVIQGGEMDAHWKMLNGIREMLQEVSNRLGDTPELSVGVYAQSARDIMSTVRLFARLLVVAGTYISGDRKPFYTTHEQLDAVKSVHRIISAASRASDPVSMVKLMEELFIPILDTKNEVPAARFVTYMNTLIKFGVDSMKDEDPKKRALRTLEKKIADEPDTADVVANLNRLAADTQKIALATQKVDAFLPITPEYWTDESGRKLPIAPTDNPALIIHNTIRSFEALQADAQRQQDLLRRLVQQKASEVAKSTQSSASPQIDVLYIQESQRVLYSTEIARLCANFAMRRSVVESIRNGPPEKPGDAEEGTRARAQRFANSSYEDASRYYSEMARQANQAGAAREAAIQADFDAKIRRIQADHENEKAGYKRQLEAAMQSRDAFIEGQKKNLEEQVRKWMESRQIEFEAKEKALRDELEKALRAQAVADASPDTQRELLELTQKLNKELQQALDEEKVKTESLKAEKEQAEKWRDQQTARSAEVAKQLDEQRAESTREIERMRAAFQKESSEKEDECNKRIDAEKREHKAEMDDLTLKLAQSMQDLDDLKQTMEQLQKQLNIATDERAQFLMDLEQTRQAMGPEKEKYAADLKKGSEELEMLRLQERLNAEGAAQSARSLGLALDNAKKENESLLRRLQEALSQRQSALEKCGNLEAEVRRLTGQAAQPARQQQPGPPPPMKGIDVSPDGAPNPPDDPESQLISAPDPTEKECARYIMEITARIFAASQSRQARLDKITRDAEEKEYGPWEKTRGHPPTFMDDGKKTDDFVASYAVSRPPFVTTGDIEDITRVEIALNDSAFVRATRIRNQPRSRNTVGPAKAVLIELVRRATESSAASRKLTVSIGLLVDILNEQIRTTNARTDYEFDYVSKTVFMAHKAIFEMGTDTLFNALSAINRILVTHAGAIFNCKFSWLKYAHENQMQQKDLLDCQERARYVMAAITDHWTGILDELTHHQKALKEWYEAWTNPSQGLQMKVDNPDEDMHSSAPSDASMLAQIAENLKTRVRSVADGIISDFKRRERMGFESRRRTSSRSNRVTRLERDDEPDGREDILRDLDGVLSAQFDGLVLSIASLEARMEQEREGEGIARISAEARIERARISLVFKARHQISLMEEELGGGDHVDVGLIAQRASCVVALLQASMETAGGEEESLIGRGVQHRNPVQNAEQIMSDMKEVCRKTMEFATAMAVSTPAAFAGVYARAITAFASSADIATISGNYARQFAELVAGGSANREKIDEAAHVLQTITRSICANLVTSVVGGIQLDVNTLDQAIARHNRAAFIAPLFGASPRVDPINSGAPPANRDIDPAQLQNYVIRCIRDVIRFEEGAQKNDIARIMAMVDTMKSNSMGKLEEWRMQALTFKDVVSQRLDMKTSVLRFLLSMADEMSKAATECAEKQIRVEPSEILVRCLFFSRYASAHAFTLVRDAFVGDDQAIATAIAASIGQDSAQQNPQLINTMRKAPVFSIEEVSSLIQLVRTATRSQQSRVLKNLCHAIWIEGESMEQERMDVYKPVLQGGNPSTIIPDRIFEAVLVGKLTGMFHALTIINSESKANNWSDDIPGNQHARKEFTDLMQMGQIAIARIYAQRKKRMDVDKQGGPVQDEKRDDDTEKLKRIFDSMILSDANMNTGFDFSQKWSEQIAAMGSSGSESYMEDVLQKDAADAAGAYLSQSQIDMASAVCRASRTIMAHTARYVLNVSVSSGHVLDDVFDRVQRTVIDALNRMEEIRVAKNNNGRMQIDAIEGITRSIMHAHFFDFFDEENAHGWRVDKRAFQSRVQGAVRKLAGDSKTDDLEAVEPRGAAKLKQLQAKLEALREKTMSAQAAEKDLKAATKEFEGLFGLTKDGLPDDLFFVDVPKLLINRTIREDGPGVKPTALGKFEAAMYASAVVAWTRRSAFMKGKLEAIQNVVDAAQNMAIPRNSVVTANLFATKVQDMIRLVGNMTALVADDTGIVVDVGPRSVAALCESLQNAYTGLLCLSSNTRMLNDLWRPLIDKIVDITAAETPPGVGKKPLKPDDEKDTKAPGSAARGASKGPQGPGIPGEDKHDQDGDAPDLITPGAKERGGDEKANGPTAYMRGVLDIIATLPWEQLSIYVAEEPQGRNTDMAKTTLLARVARGWRNLAGTKLRANSAEKDWPLLALIQDLAQLSKMGGDAGTTWAIASAMGAYRPKTGVEGFDMLEAVVSAYKSGGEQPAKLALTASKALDEFQTVCSAAAAAGVEIDAKMRQLADVAEAHGAYMIQLTTDVIRELSSPQPMEEFESIRRVDAFLDEMRQAIKNAQARCKIRIEDTQRMYSKYYKRNMSTLDGAIKSITDSVKTYTKYASDHSERFDVMIHVGVKWSRMLGRLCMQVFRAVAKCLPFTADDTKEEAEAGIDVPVRLAEAIQQIMRISASAAQQASSESIPGQVTEHELTMLTGALPAKDERIQAFERMSGGILHAFVAARATESMEKFVMNAMQNPDNNDSFSIQQGSKELASLVKACMASVLHALKPVSPSNKKMRLIDPSFNFDAASRATLRDMAAEIQRVYTGLQGMGPAVAIAQGGVPVMLGGAASAPKASAARASQQQYNASGGALIGGNSQQPSEVLTFISNHMAVRASMLGVALGGIPWYLTGSLVCGRADISPQQAFQPVVFFMKDPSMLTGLVSIYSTVKLDDSSSLRLGPRIQGPAVGAPAEIGSQRDNGQGYSITITREKDQQIAELFKKAFELYKKVTFYPGSTTDAIWASIFSDGVASSLIQAATYMRTIKNQSGDMPFRGAKIADLMMSESVRPVFAHLVSLLYRRESALRDPKFMAKAVRPGMPSAFSSDINIVQGGLSSFKRTNARMPTDAFDLITRRLSGPQQAGAMQARSLVRPGPSAPKRLADYINYREEDGDDNLGTVITWEVYDTDVFGVEDAWAVV